MTVEEKVERLEKFCEAHPMCNDPTTNFCCPLYLNRGDCYDETDPDSVNRSYEIVFSSDTETPKTISTIDHPYHYNQGGIECIDAMISAFGKEAVANFCICNAFKYIWRAAHKNGQEDVEKSKWYLNKYEELSYENN